MRYKLIIFLNLLSAFPLVLINDAKFGISAANWNTVVVSISLICFILSFYFVRNIYSSYQKLKNGINTMKDEDFTLFLNKNAKNEFEILVDVYNDMLEKLRKKRIENKQLQLFFESVIQRLPFAIIILKENKYLSFANNHAEKLLKFNASKIANNEFALVKHHLATTILESQTKNGIIVKKYGEEIKIIKSNFTREGMQFNLYVLEELTSSLIQNQLESWKKMIRVMNHEINNSISPIISITQSLMTYIDSNKDFDTDLKEGVRSTSSRLKHLSDFINDYSQIAKLPNLKRVNISLNHFMNRIIKLMINIKDKNLKINFTNESKCEFMFIDENLFEQALINIIKNGIEASDNDTKIIIDITIRKIRGRHHIIITDYGKGIPPEVFENLFVPYFTTKKSGSGIGLSFVQEILSKHEFKYFIESELNKGSSFYIEIH